MDFLASQSDYCTPRFIGATLYMAGVVTNLCLYFVFRIPRATSARVLVGAQHSSHFNAHGEIKFAAPATTASPFFHTTTQAARNMATFQRVATVINLYKVARYDWNEAEYNESISAEEKLARRGDFLAAERDLAQLIDTMGSLPPACRKQLNILYYETHSQGRRVAPISYMWPKC